MALHQKVVCPACASDKVFALPVPRTGGSMLSDGQVIPRTLQKSSCQSCGYGFHTEPPSAEELRDCFDDDYSLGQHDPDAELMRAQQYASIIEPFLLTNGVNKPFRLIELGCGMGSLLSILGKRWSCEAVWGVEPSKQLSDEAHKKKSENTTIWQGFAENIAEEHKGSFNLCISVNVIEHTLSPENFLAVCGTITQPSGHILVICPDGESPNLELLFYDHISSFTRGSLAHFANRAGLDIVATQTLDGSLLGFQMLLLQRTSDKDITFETPAALTWERVDFLESWRNSPDHIASVLDGQPYVVFGAGEVADLLSAYCPQIIESAHSIVVDSPATPTYLGKPVISTDSFLRELDMAIVAAVNLRSWMAVRERFRALGIDIYHPQQRRD